MKKNLSLAFVLLIFVSCSFKSKEAEPMNELIDRVFDVARLQTLAMAQYLDQKPERLPRSFDQLNDSIITSNSRWWCSGFFPGQLWYLHEYYDEPLLQQKGEEFLSRVEKEKYNTYDHDIGFQIFCSFGNAYRITGNDLYHDVIITAANSAIKRFNDSIGLIKSWDHRENLSYPVIIDNMMNLELLMWAFQQTGDSVYYHVAISHADNTLIHHFREDHSSYHLVSYDPETLMPEIKQTVQGAFNESVWARGQAWGLYGFTMMYKYTGYTRYLEKARNIADFLIDHPNMPADMVPYWDLLAPNIPDELRDASAASIMAAALVDLSGAVDEPSRSIFLQAAETQLRTLASAEYLAQPGENGFFLLRHGVGHYPKNSEVDVPLTYADYYFIEALSRLKKQI